LNVEKQQTVSLLVLMGRQQYLKLGVITGLVASDVLVIALVWSNINLIRKDAFRILNSFFISRSLTKGSVVEQCLLMSPSSPLSLTHAHV
jgi:predicted small secreted protein